MFAGLGDVIPSPKTTFFALQTIRLVLPLGWKAIFLNIVLPLSVIVVPAIMNFASFVSL